MSKLPSYPNSMTIPASNGHIIPVRNSYQTRKNQPQVQNEWHVEKEIFKILERAPKIDFDEFLKLYLSLNDANTRPASRASHEKAPVVGDIFLGNFLQSCLDKILHVANSEEIREALVSFSNSIACNRTEVIRRKAYDTLCSRSLDALSQIENLPPNQEATLGNLDLSCASPRSISKRRSEDADHGAHASTKRARLASVCVASTGIEKIDIGSEGDQVLSTEAQAQVAAHGPMKMLSTYGPRAEDVINMLIVDDTLCLWAYDRQDIIQSNGISITADFTRFLVLLLAIDRCNVEDWGVPWANTLENISINKSPARSAKKVLCPPSMLQHLPVPYFSGDLRAGDTPRARSILGISGKGHRTLRVVVSEELVLLTSQTGQPFVDAWLDAVTCHAFLWKHGVEHNDPSLLNVMYHPARKCGVLTDFDLSVIAWQARIPGTDRTGTIPFMALELLDDQYWAGSITRRYHHELEAFIWMLPFVFLAYNHGKFDPKTKFIKDWITSEHIACATEKVYFLISKLGTAKGLITAAFRDYGTLMSDACLMVRRLHLERGDQANGLMWAPPNPNPPAHLKDGNLSPSAPHIAHSIAMWDQFVTVLSKSGIATAGLEKHRPVFDPAQNQDLFKEMEAIHESSPRVCSPSVL